MAVWIDDTRAPWEAGAGGSALCAQGTRAEWQLLRLGLGDSLSAWTIVLSPVASREEARPGGCTRWAGCCHLPFFSALGLVLFTLLLRVPAVLRVITENSSPHPFTFQAAKRLQPP